MNPYIKNLRKIEFVEVNNVSRFLFKQMTMEDVPVYADIIFSILAENMSVIAPTGNSYDEDYKIWLGFFEAALRENRNHIILAFYDETLCGYFQYSFHGTTFRMEEIQFKPEYQGSGLFAELYRHLIPMIPEHIISVDAFARKENKKSQEILKHLGLTVIGENKNGKSLHFKGDYKTLSERYS